MNRTELRVTGSLAAVFSLRLFGLFMIFPVFEAYARGLTGATPYLIGEALGIYGLTQGLLQIPFGLMSDRYGRKRLIVIGLVMFAVGSAVAALSTSIAGMIVGRALQGAGAVGSVILALTADLTSESNRTKAMALIGVSIGIAFILAIITGPVFAALIGVGGIFWLMVALAIGGVGVTLFVVPDPRALKVHDDAEAVPGLFGAVLRDGHLLSLNIGIFVLHAVLTASFLAVPGLIRVSFALPPHDDWMIYVGVLLVSVVIMAPTILWAEKRKQVPAMLVASIGGILVSQLAIHYGAQQPVVLIGALVVFFSAFNILEASLPSLVSKTAPRHAKGTALGIFSSLQFLGIFAGGALGGWTMQHGGAEAVFLLTAGLTLVWLAATLALRARQDG